MENQLFTVFGYLSILGFLVSNVRDLWRPFLRFVSDSSLSLSYLDFSLFSFLCGWLDRTSQEYLFWGEAFLLRDLDRNESVVPGKGSFVQVI